MGCQGLHGRIISDPEIMRQHSTVRMEIQNLPRALSSCTQPRTRSWTSSGATSVRCHASVHLGFAGVVSTVVVGFGCFLVVESLPRKTREKKDMTEMRCELTLRVRNPTVGEIGGPLFFGFCSSTNN